MISVSLRAVCARVLVTRPSSLSAHEFSHSRYPHACAPSKMSFRPVSEPLVIRTRSLGFRVSVETSLSDAFGDLGIVHPAHIDRVSAPGSGAAQGQVQLVIIEIGTEVFPAGVP